MTNTSVQEKNGGSELVITHTHEGGGVCVLTGIASLAVDAFLGSAANGPVPVHKEAVAQRVAQPLHGRRDAAAGRQAGLPGAAQEHTLSEGKTSYWRHLPSVKLSSCLQVLELITFVSV